MRNNYYVTHWAVVSATALVYMHPIDCCEPNVFFEISTDNLNSA
ncbi:hypothetical protein HMPREF1991_02051 [Hoylesella loescheii DSM 19665 = JCM 12249 = ATCC 15930]|uniref:Uncharacterized protein n=1 Tax=Hoylesella loescheii DSM 19665 = JCM 12249 = ATCC 15930 TaxID=1122985 RepID=A0A069QGA5_HOYLO|nr:hypothetical protein HMPREF1991_02051 [Hoylesella loescheii DSM 19665 = JCM 12249 = ATCC 15930]